MVTSYKSLVDHINNLNITNIITNDSHAWNKNKDHNFIYNKLWVAMSQEIPTGPMGIYPEKYPVIFKPIINLFGMSRGFKIIRNEEEYDKNIKDGFFWEEFIEGEHFCVDLIVVKGQIKFYSALKSYPDGEGGFIYHESIPNYKLPEHIRYWIKLHFAKYTGCLNLEIINGLIIEGHLRLNGDFHLYDESFVLEMEKLFLNGKWNLNYKIKKKYLFPIFVKKDFSDEDVEIMKNKINNFIINKDVSTINFDNINSKCQSEWKSRLSMIETENPDTLKELYDYFH